MSDPAARDATLRLWGHPPTPATLRATVRSPRTRLVRALLALLLFWVLAPLVFIVPPHLPWALIAFVAGIYFAYRQWNGPYRVHRFEGACPRCGEPLSIPQGSTINLPHTLTCFNCHHEPTLEVGAG